MTVLYLPLAFAMALVVDWSYTRWVSAIQKRSRLEASIFSGMCSFIGIVSIVLCLEHWSMVIASVVGHALGTWIAVGPARDEE